MSANTSPNDTVAREILYRELARAPSFQGGHSTEGRKIAGILGVPFPLNMDDLEKRAHKLNMDTSILWPWRTPKTQSK